MIRPMLEGDWEAWKPLWDGYLHFYRMQLDERTTRSSFTRLCAKEQGMLGLIALDERGAGLGLAHVVFHASTWTSTSYCYLEDLFVAQQARGSDLGRQLIHAVYAEAERAKSARVYWHTQQYNAQARSLYDQVAHPTSFVVYQR